jgi:hypothetical protein
MQALGYWIFLVGCWIFKKGGVPRRGSNPLQRRQLKIKQTESFDRISKKQQRS